MQFSMWERLNIQALHYLEIQVLYDWIVSKHPQILTIHLGFPNHSLKLMVLLLPYVQRSGSRPQNSVTLAELPSSFCTYY
jgi:hypothetical protein